MKHDERPPVGYAEYLSKAREGDQDALGWLLSTELPWITSHAKQATASMNSRWTVRDLVQECCLAALSASGSTYATSRGQFRSWLKTILHNHVRNELRRHQPVSLTGELESELCIAPTKDSSTLNSPEGLAASRARLPFGMEASLLLRDWCGCSFETITAVLGCRSRREAYRLRSRAMATLGSSKKSLAVG